MSAQYQWNVVEDLVPPVVSGVDVIDGRTLEVLFSEVVVEVEALTPANYVFDNGLAVLALTKVSGTQYRITTTLQIPGQAYQLTVSNVHDMSGNTI